MEENRKKSGVAALVCGIVGIIGSFIGSKCLVKLNSKWLEITFIIFLFYSGFSFLLK